MYAYFYRHKQKKLKKNSLYFATRGGRFHGTTNSYPESFVDDDVVVIVGSLEVKSLYTQHSHKATCNPNNFPFQFVKHSNDIFAFNKRNSTSKQQQKNGLQNKILFYITWTFRALHIFKVG